MRSNQLEMNIWEIKCEVLKLKKLLSLEKDSNKRIELIEDLIKFKSLINLIPTFNCNLGITYKEYKEDLEIYSQKNEEYLQEFIDILKFNSDFFMQLAKNYKKLSITKISDDNFKLTDVSYDEIIEIIKYTFNGRFSEFFIKELESNRYHMIDKKDALKHNYQPNSTNISLKNSKYANYYVFSKTGNITYYDLYNIISELSRGYSGLYYNITSYNYFNNLLPYFNQLLIGENINCSKSLNDYLLNNFKMLNKMIDNSTMLEKLLEYNWDNNYSIKVKNSYNYNSQNYNIISDLFDSIIAFILYREYKIDKEYTLYKLNYIRKHSKKDDIFKCLNDVGVKKDDILDTKYIKKYINNIESKCKI